MPSTWHSWTRARCAISVCRQPCHNFRLVINHRRRCLVCGPRAIDTRPYARHSLTAVCLSDKGEPITCIVSGAAVVRTGAADRPTPVRWPRGPDVSVKPLFHVAITESRNGIRRLAVGPLSGALRSAVVVQRWTYRLALIKCFSF
jgi:hypothetical protein